MKKSVITLFLLFSVIICYSQGQKRKGGFKVNPATIDASQVPDVVKQSVVIGATSDIRWEKHLSEGKKGHENVRYVAVYAQDGIRTRRRFKEDGTKLSASRYLSAANLPSTISTAATNKIPGAKLVGAEEVTTKSGQVIYRVRLKNGSSKVTTLLDSQGNEISKEKVTEEMKEGENEEGDKEN